MVNFSLRQVRYFVTIADRLSLSKAARVLGLSQSALTNSLAELESTLGHKLVNRTPKGVTLTEEGQKFLVSCQRIMDAVEDASHSLGQEKQRRGELIIGVTPIISAYLLPALLHRFRQRYPGVNIRLHEDREVMLMRQLQQGNLDLVLSLGQSAERETEGQTEEQDVLFRCGWQLWVPASHPLATRSDVCLADLVQESLLWVENEELELAQARLWAEFPGRMPRTSVNSVGTARSLVGAGAGVAMMPEFIFRPWSIDMHRLVGVPISDKVPAFEVRIFTPPSPSSWVCEAFEAFSRKAGAMNLTQTASAGMAAGVI